MRMTTPWLSGSQWVSVSWAKDQRFYNGSQTGDRPSPHNFNVFQNGSFVVRNHVNAVRFLHQELRQRAANRGPKPRRVRGGVVVDRPRTAWCPRLESNQHGFAESAPGPQKYLYLQLRKIR
jgi:hypothetical protein